MKKPLPKPIYKEGVTIIPRPVDVSTEDVMTASTPASSTATQTMTPGTSPLTTWAALRKKMPDSAVSAHVHDYISITGRKIGDGKTILYRECACSKLLAFEMGETEAMRVLYLKIKGAKT